jgi:uncharacterized protein YlaN (UPF0358 family)
VSDENEEHFISIDGSRFDLKPLYLELDPVQDVKVDQSDLHGEFMRQSELSAAYGYLTAEAEKQEKLVEYQLERLHAMLDKQVRDEFAMAGERATENKIRNSVITHREYQEVKLELIEARKNKQLFKATCGALSHKLQALINAGADHRKTFVEPTILRDQ